MMNKLLPNILLLSLALLPLASCEEWDPVLTGTYPEPDPRTEVRVDVNTTIAQLKQLYVDNGGKAVEIKDHLCIAGQVISSDRSGNIYRDLYLQDDTGAICVKVGKSSLYSDYQLGQWVYVDCCGLKIGSYNGMPQLGIEDESDSGYDTAYIDAQYLIDTHIWRGRTAALPEPCKPTAAELSTALSEGGFKNHLWGRLITLEGMTYGAASSYNTDKYKRIFAILYIDDKTENRVFLSDRTYGVTTWAMTKSKLLENIEAGKFEGVSTQGGAKVEGELLEALKANASPVTMSQYFSFGSVPVQIRTSGYSKFADTEIDPEVIGDPDSSSADGAPVDVTGILTIYSGAAQFTLIDLDGVKRSASR